MRAWTRTTLRWGSGVGSSRPCPAHEREVLPHALRSLAAEDTCRSVLEVRVGEQFAGEQDSRAEVVGDVAVLEPLQGGFQARLGLQGFVVLEVLVDAVVGDRWSNWGSGSIDRKSGAKDLWQIAAHYLP